MSNIETVKLGDIARQRGGIGRGCLISIIVVVVLVIGGGVGLYFWGTGYVEDQAKIAVQDDPVLKEHIGEIEEIDLNLQATGTASGKQDEDAEEKRTVLVFDLVGSKGSGQLTVAMGQGEKDGMAFSDGSITMSDGKKFDLELPKTAPKPDAEGEKDELVPEKDEAEPAPKNDDDPAPKKDD